MQVQVNTDKNIDAPEGTIASVDEELRTILGYLVDRITRIEVHLSDQSAGRSSGEDKRCMLEARPAGSGPVAVTAQAATIERALREAAHKLKNLLVSDAGGVEGRNARDSIRGKPRG